MSIWQFNAAVRGYIRANTPQTDKGQFKSEEEVDDIFSWLMASEIPKKKLLKNKVYLWDGVNFIFQKEVDFELENE